MIDNAIAVINVLASFRSYDHCIYVLGNMVECNVVYSLVNINVQYLHIDVSCDRLFSRVLYADAHLIVVVQPDGAILLIHASIPISSSSSLDSSESDSLFRLSCFDSS